MKFNTSHHYEISLDPEMFFTLYCSEGHLRFLDDHLGVKKRILISNALQGKMFNE